MKCCTDLGEISRSDGRRGSSKRFLQPIFYGTYHISLPLGIGGRSSSRTTGIESTSSTGGLDGRSSTM